MAWRRPSQSLKSPTTATLRALGAQTAKLTPSTPSIETELGAEFIVDAVLVTLAEKVEIGFARVAGRIRIARLDFGAVLFVTRRS